MRTNEAENVVRRLLAAYQQHDPSGLEDEMTGAENWLKQAHERSPEAAPPSGTRCCGLREHEHPTWPVYSEHPFGWPAGRHRPPLYRPERSAGAAPLDADRLDVERIARALHAATQALAYIDLSATDVQFGGQEPFMRVAEAIVAADAASPKGTDR